VKIFVIDLLNIGDVLFTTPALRSLRKAYPNADITMLVNQRFIDVVKHNPNLDCVIGIDKNGYHRSPRHFLELVSEIRQLHCDMAINLHGDARSSLITLLSGAEQKCGLVSRGFEKLYHRPVMQRVDIHRVDSYLEILSALGIEPHEDRRMEMHTDEASGYGAARMWTDAGLDGCGQVIGLNPGASVLIKQWPGVRWTELIQQLHDVGYRTAMFGGPRDVDTVRQIISSVGNPPVVFTGRLDLLELAALTGKCAVFVSTDTGPMHIAVTQQTPVVALFGPTNPLEFGPYMTSNIVCRASGHCTGCRRGARDAHLHSCLSSISAADVVSAVTRLLSVPSANRE